MFWWTTVKIYKNGKGKVKGKNKSEYSWDGCSPKIKFSQLSYLGTPDDIIDPKTDKPYTYYASMIHDVIYQFKDIITISRKEADIIFKLLLKEYGFIIKFIIMLLDFLGDYMVDGKPKNHKMK